jgi:hypothetical protein
LKKQGSIKPGQSILLIATSIILMLIIQIVGCSDCNKGKTTVVQPPTIILTPKIVDCINGKTIKITGNYDIGAGVSVEVKREGKITNNLFKVQEQGTDQLQENVQKINWKGNLIEFTFIGTNGESGILEEDCYKIKYKSQTFTISGKNCIFEASGEICEDCELTKAEWKITCDGDPKASGSWSIVDSQ